jgi:2-oxoglutarate ferredoxin oxidoreductase subunit alpha
MGAEAFDIAERFQTPVFVLSDLDLGMNVWMSDPFPYPEKAIDRGKVLSRADLDRLGGFARYADPDGDGIGWRTLPGTDHPAAAYFTRGTGHDERAHYSERPDDWEHNLRRVARKIDGARAALPAPVAEGRGAAVGILCAGTSGFAVAESRDQLRRERRLETDGLRVRAFPFADSVRDFVAAHDRVYVVDQNRDGQLAQLLRLDLPADLGPRLRSLSSISGLPLDARTVTEAVAAREG